MSVLMHILVYTWLPLTFSGIPHLLLSCIILFSLTDQYHGLGSRFQRYGSHCFHGTRLSVPQHDEDFRLPCVHVGVRTVQSSPVTVSCQYVFEIFEGVRKTLGNKVSECILTYVNVKCQSEVYIALPGRCRRLHDLTSGAHSFSYVF